MEVAGEKGGAHKNRFLFFKCTLYEEMYWKELENVYFTKTKTMQNVYYLKGNFYSILSKKNLDKTGWNGPLIEH